MDLASLEDTLPNGFHDAELSGIDVDAASGTATIHMRLLISLPDAAVDEVVVYKSADIQLTELKVIDFPEQLLQSAWPATDVQGFVPNEQQWPRLSTLDAETKRLAYSFYIHNLNDFLHTAASHAELSWQE